jgi:hypothetical protein
MASVTVRFLNLAIASLSRAWLYLLLLRLTLGDLLLDDLRRPVEVVVRLQVRLVVRRVGALELGLLLPHGLLIGCLLRLRLA